MIRQLLCVLVLALAVACRGVDWAACQPAERASRALQAAIDEKPDLARYHELLGTFAVAIAEAGRHAHTPRERAAVAEYQTALRELTDVRLVWEEKEARGSELLPIRDELPGRIAREYDLGVNTNEPPSIYASEAVHVIWEAALSHLRAATRALG